MKTCRKCNIEKELVNFCYDKKASDGLQSYCKECKTSLIYEYYQKYPERRRKRSREENRQRYYNNRLHQNIGRILRMGLKTNKRGKTFDILGFSVKELKEHLESLFKEGMTWDNYGEWHIDHKIPRSLLPYSYKEDENFIKCWSLDNLQPLWKIENLKKSNKYAAIF